MKEQSKVIFVSAGGQGRSMDGARCASGGPCPYKANAILAVKNARIFDFLFLNNKFIH